MKRVTILVAVALCASARFEPVTAQVSCAPCHGELELLRQHVPSLADAERLWVAEGAIENSAHAQETCASCHLGYRQFPHTEPSEVRTCVSCHEDSEAAWTEGTHASDSAASCADCHGVHDVRSVESLHTPEGIADVRELCASCHFEPRVGADDPHGTEVTCATCHAPHATLPVTDPGSPMHESQQDSTCGSCHEDALDAWRGDAHALARIPGDEAATRAALETPPCTGCHGGHDMVRPSESRRAEIQLSAVCVECHEEQASSFADSYHGQAGELGSDAVATCVDCHGSHGIYGSEDPRSMTSGERILATCQSCHENATVGFTLFQPHADHHDRDRYPYVFWAYRLMTGLLVGVFGFFGAHSALWLIRSALDRLHAASAEGAQS